MSGVVEVAGGGAHA